MKISKCSIATGVILLLILFFTGCDDDVGVPVMPEDVPYIVEETHREIQFSPPDTIPSLRSKYNTLKNMEDLLRILRERFNIHDTDIFQRMEITSSEEPPDSGPPIDDEPIDDSPPLDPPDDDDEEPETIYISWGSFIDHETKLP